MALDTWVQDLLRPRCTMTRSDMRYNAIAKMAVADPIPAVLRFTLAAVLAAIPTVTAKDRSQGWQETLMAVEGPIQAIRPEAGIRETAVIQTAPRVQAHPL